MIKTIDAAAFCAAVIHGAAAISASTQAVNELNVFPVPDGDTGTNMSMTIRRRRAEGEALSHRFRSGLCRGLRTSAGGAGQLGRDLVPAVPGLFQGREGQGDH
jgi:hypothetical protein